MKSFIATTRGAIARTVSGGALTGAIVLGALALAGTVPVTPAAAAPTAAAAAEVLPTIPFKLINKSGSRKDLYVYVVGMDGPTWYYMTDKSGNIAAFTEQTTPVPFGFSVGKARRTTITLPQLQAMRIYFSFGKPLKLTVSSANVPGVPAGWAKGDPNYRTLFDWTEFTWVQDGVHSTLGGNATQVDMFGFATRIKLAGKQGDYTTPVVKRSGFRAKYSRRQILADLRQAKRPWKKLLVGRKRNPRRAIAPYHGMDAGVFPTKQLNSYINDVWKTYETGKMTAKPQNVAYTGQVENGNLVFKKDGDPATSFSFPKPTTRQVYEGAILPDPMPADVLVEQQARAIGALLQGAFLRSTLNKQGNLESCRKRSFYKNAPVNEYAKAIHKPSIARKAYAFGYDDTCSQSSYIGVHDPDWMRIDILPLK